jgi:large subunit ribosomal protein L29
MRLLGDAEMLERLSESRRELFNLRFQLATGQLDNSSRLGAVRRDIARLATFLREREIAAAEAAGEGE